ncbi:hypothetical protein D3C79_410620 [compost metagenome]
MGLGKLLHEEVVLARAGLAIARHRHDPLLGHGGLLRLQAGRLVQVLEQGLEARQLGGEAADGALLSLDAVQLLLQQLVHVLALDGHQLHRRAGRIYLHLYPLIQWHACWKTPARPFPTDKRLSDKAAPFGAAMQSINAAGKLPCRSSGWSWTALTCQPASASGSWSCWCSPGRSRHP